MEWRQCQRWHSPVEGRNAAGPCAPLFLFGVVNSENLRVVAKRIVIALTGLINRLILEVKK